MKKAAPIASNEDLLTLVGLELSGPRAVKNHEDAQKYLDMYIARAKPEELEENAEKYWNGIGVRKNFDIGGALALAAVQKGNKANVCFIGTPHAELTFTPAMWENMNRKEFHLTGSWMSYSAPFPGKEWELTAHYFATGQLKFDPGFIYKKVPMSQAQEAFQMFKTPGLVKGKVLLVNES